MKYLPRVILWALFTLLILAQAWFIVALFKLDLLPAPYTAAILAVLVLVSALLGLITYTSIHKRTRLFWLRRIIAGILCVSGTIGFCFAKDAVDQFDDTISNVTTTPIISAIVELYVLDSNAATTIDDTVSYRFAVTKSFDWKSTSKAIATIESNLNVTLITVEYPTVFAMVDALYAQEVDAMLMNSAYLEILEEMENYSDFQQRTRNIYEYAVIETTPPTQPVVDPKPSIPTHTQPEQSEEIAPFIIYISGSDTRNQVSLPGRSDVNILVVVNPNTHQILLINTPRDSYVENTAMGGALDKLTHCGLYGVDCSISTLENLYCIDIDYYARINFSGFETLIDAIGGITIHSDYSFTTTHGNYKIVKGENQLNGSQALCYARERYQLPGGERERGKNQMALITAVIKKMLSGSLFTHYTEILDSMENMFYTNFPQESISQLFKMQLSQMPNWEIMSYAMNGTPGYDVTCTMPGVELYVLYPGEKYVNQAADLINRVLSGEVITANDLK